MVSSELGTTKMEFSAAKEFAEKMDNQDQLRDFRKEFLFPKSPKGGDCLYLAGNSLGLEPRNARKYIEEELEDWAQLGVEGHWDARHPWLPYHENLTEMTARLVGAQPIEVVVMNTLTVNLHLMMVSFYRPTKNRYKILTEHSPFPSDKYAVDSQAGVHGFDAKHAVVELQPRAGEALLRTEDIVDTIKKHGDSIALVLLGQVNYLSGQAFDVPTIARAAHEKGCMFGLNLAHGAGNLLLRLHDWDVDFAVWCGYKYLNSGPGALAGCFVHERHGKNTNLPRFAGWWGHDKASRFQMGPQFKAIEGAEGWQLSNPPIFQLAALRASLELFDKATMPALRSKSELLTGYLEYLLTAIPDQFVTVITPRDASARGCQLSCRLKGNPRKLVEHLRSIGAICDFREPDIIRMAPTPLYNSFTDVHRFASAVADCAAGKV
jgi:kynureninase